MIFCEHCFNDREIAAMICGIPFIKTGECPVCHSTESHLYDTDEQMALTPFFEELLSIYTPASMLPDTYPREEITPLIDELDARWNIFSGISRQDKDKIIKSVCGELYDRVPELFDGSVGIMELYDSEYLKDHAMLKNYDWDSFVKEIKEKNRYHSNVINFKIFEKYCTFIKKTYKEGTQFYRARISGQYGYPITEMSAPKPGTSAEGRANARGITCLYVSGDPETPLYEVRAGALDYVSVGTFRLKKDISVVDLRLIDSLSPFVFELDCLEHAINKQYLERLNNEMSKALRRSDSTLDYVPTQYLVDFIKSIKHNGEQEYAGVVYNSTMNRSGYNLAIFDPDLLECISVNVYDIEDLSYSKKQIK